MEIVKCIAVNWRTPVCVLLWCYLEWLIVPNRNYKDSSSDLRELLYDISDNESSSSDCSEDSLLDYSSGSEVNFVPLIDLIAYLFSLHYFLLNGYIYQCSCWYGWQDQLHPVWAFANKITYKQTHNSLLLPLT